MKKYKIILLALAVLATLFWCIISFVLPARIEQGKVEKSEESSVQSVELYIPNSIDQVMRLWR